MHRPAFHLWLLFIGFDFGSGFLIPTGRLIHYSLVLIFISCHVCYAMFFHALYEKKTPIDLAS